MAMNMVTNYMRSFGSSGSQNAISEKFEDHKRSLSDHKWKADEAIDDWSNAFIDQIKEYALKQKGLVEEAYQIHQKHLENMREQFLETSNFYEEKNNTEEIQRLLEKCKKLEVELVNCKFSAINKDFLEITLVEPREWMEEEGFNPGKTEDDELQNPSMGRDKTGSVYERDLDSPSSPKFPASSLDQTNEPSTTQSIYNDDRSRSSNDNNNPKTDSNTDTNSIDKCPMCFMIFSSNMSTTARETHVEEHYNDE